MNDLFCMMAVIVWAIIEHMRAERAERRLAALIEAGRAWAAKAPYGHDGECPHRYCDDVDCDSDCKAAGEPCTCSSEAAETLRDAIRDAGGKP